MTCEDCHVEMILIATKEQQRASLLTIEDHWLCSQCEFTIVVEKDTILARPEEYKIGSECAASKEEQIA